MIVNKVEMFPTLLYVVNDFLNSTQIKEIINYGKTLENKHHGCIPENGISNHCVSYSFLDDVFNNVLSCRFLKQSIEQQLAEYGKQCGYPNLLLSNSWINYQYKDSELLKHTHPNSCVSAVLYLNVDNDSSKIYFYNPNPYVTFVDYVERTKYNFEHQWIRPCNGDLVLFPSWLAHGSNRDKNQTDERVAVSFNTRGA